MYHQYDIPTNQPTSQSARRSCQQTRWRLLFSGLIFFTTFPTFADSVPLTGVSQLWKGGQSNHSCVLTSSGGVKCWGLNSSGQLGDNTTTSRLTAVYVTGLTSGVTAIAMGALHTCALSSGGVQCWGYNSSGQLGNNTTTWRLAPVAVSGLTGVTAIAAGDSHTCALTSGGAVKCWGLNSSGQLGNNTTTKRLIPVAVTGLTSDVTAIAAGYSHTCALTSSGGVKCWGANSDGQLGDNTTTSRLTFVDVTGLTSVTAIAVGGYHTCALTSSSGVKCWGDNYSGQLGDNTTINRLTSVDVTGLTSVTAIAMGGYHTCALTSSSGVKCWGDNSSGQLGDNTLTTRHIPVDVTGLTSGVMAMTTGYKHTCALTSSGGVNCWGNNGEGQLGDNTTYTTNRLTPVAVDGLTSGVTTIATGYGHTCALTSSGGVNCWGDNASGQLGDNTTIRRYTPVDVSGLTSGVTAIDTGYHHTCALTSSGGVQCWGDNGFGQLGDNTTTSRLTFVDVTGLTSDVTAIAVGHGHTCAKTSSGGVKCWGYNSSGQLGDNTTTSRLTFVDVTNLTSDVTAIATGYGHTCALTSSGGVKCWGYNNSGQLGDNTTTNRLTPVAVTGLTGDVMAIAAGDYHTCALTNSGAVKCWGYNYYGQLGDNTTINRLTPVAVTGLTSGLTAIATGYAHTCAKTDSGGVKCWGYNSDGQLGDNTTTTRLTAVAVTGLTSGMMAIAAGDGHTCALSSGGIQCWGDNNSGQLGDPPSYTPVEVLELVDTLPTAESMSISLNPNGLPSWGVGETLKGNYTYNDVDSQVESGTLFQWYQATDASCSTGKTVITGATAQTYMLASGNMGKYICFSVTPKNAQGTGIEVLATSSNLIVKGNQTISFTPPTNGSYNGNTTLSATATSGLTVTFASTTTGICTVNSTTVSYVSVGTCTLTANQAGNANYNAAPQVSGNLTVGKANQTLSFTPPASGNVSGSATLSATATSSLTVTFASTTTGICTVSGNLVSYVSAGTCTLTANQAGNANYNAAPQVSGNLTVTQAALTQTLTFTPPASGITGGSATLSATATSGLTVTFASTTTGICTVSGNLVSYVSAGTCTLTANQAGNANYNAAPQVTGNLTVTQAALTQTLTFIPPASGITGGSATLSATATSGLTVTFASTTPSVCTVNGTTVSYVGAGTCTLTATQAGNASYNAAPVVTQTVTVDKAPLTLTADDKTITEGNALPTFTVTANGFVKGDTLAVLTGLILTTTATANSPAGVYPITVTASAANYNLTLQAGTLTIQAAGFLVTQTNDSTVVTEGGATDQINLKLANVPTAAVMVTVLPENSLDLNNGGSVPVTLTFTPSTWNISQTLTVGALDDSVVEGKHTGELTFLTASTDVRFHNKAVAPVAVTILDNDVGVLVPDSPVAVTDPGVATYTVQLSTIPTGTVTITLTSSNPQVIFTPATLTFTADASTLEPRTVTVTVPKNFQSHPREPLTITQTVTQSADPNYPTTMVLSQVQIDTSSHSRYSKATLTVQVNGGGSVMTNAGNLDCQPRFITKSCQARYTIPTDVRLRPQAQPGFIFSDWQGDADCLDGHLRMIPGKDTRCTANFIRLSTSPTVRLQIEFWGTGQVTSNLGEMVCQPSRFGKNACQGSYVPGTLVILTAIPAAGYQFHSWSGDRDCSDGQVLMAQDLRCKATFISSTGKRSSLEEDTHR